MARIPDLASSERPGIRTPGGIATYTPISGKEGAAAEALFKQGEVLEGAGNQIFAADRAERERLRVQSEKLANEQKREQDRLDTIRAEDAFTQLRERQLDLTMGEARGFTKVRGNAAVSRPLMREYGEQWDKEVEGIAGGLSNDEQKRRFKARAGLARIQFDDDLLRHLARENDNFAAQTHQGTLITERRNASARWDSPNDVGLSIVRIENSIRQEGDRLNLPTDAVEAMRLEEISKVHQTVIQQAIATGNVSYAEEWFKKNREYIDPETARVVERTVRDGVQRDAFNGLQRRYIDNTNSRKGLEALLKDVGQNTVIGEDRQNILLGRIQGRLDTLQHKAEMASERYLRTVERGLNEVRQNTLAGYEPTPEQFAGILQSAKGTELEPLARQTVQLANATRAFRSLPPMVQEAELAKAEAAVRTDPTKADRGIVTAWRSIYEAARRDATSAPYTFAVRQGLVDPVPVDIANPEKNPQALAQRFQIGRQMAAQYQVPFAPLAPEEARTISTALKNYAPREKAAYFSKLAQAAGTDYAGYSAIMGQIAKDDPVTAIAGNYQFRGRSQAAELMLAGQEILNPPKKEDGHPVGGKLTPMPKENDLRLRWDNTVRDAYAGKPGAADATYQAAKAIYAKLSADAGDTSVLDSSRWDKAIELATGGVTKWRGRTTLLPYGQTEDQFSTGISARLRELEIRGQLPKDWTPQKLMDLPLEVTGDGRYVFRSGDSVIANRDANGVLRPIVIDFNTGLPFRSSGQGLQERTAPPSPAELDAARRPVPGRALPRPDRQ